MQPLAIGRVPLPFVTLRETRFNYSSAASFNREGNFQVSRPMFRVMALASLVALASCHRQADPPGEAPTGLAVEPGDGQVTVRWDTQPGLIYWIFFQAGSTVTAAAPGVPLIFDAVSPRVVTGLLNGTQYAFLMNASNRDSRAGPSTPVVLGVPRLAGAVWDISGAPLVRNTPQNLNGLAFSAATSRIVAVGNVGTIFAGTYSYTTSSPNPGVSAWTLATVPAGFTSNLSAAIYTGVQFLALGTDGSVSTSPDGSTWTSGSSIPSGGASMNGLALGVSAGTLVYVAVGAAGSMFTSRDLLTWTAVTPATPNDLFSVSYINATGIFVATGANGTILTSTDAVTWISPISIPSTTSALRGAAFGTGSAGARYVVVGDAGTILTSIDGANWGLTPPPLPQDLRSVTFGSRFVAVGQGGAVAYSDDGTTNWQLSSAGAADLSAVIFPPAMYLAVGASGANAVSK